MGIIPTTKKLRFFAPPGRLALRFAPGVVGVPPSSRARSASPGCCILHQPRSPLRAPRPAPRALRFPCAPARIPCGRSVDSTGRRPVVLAHPRTPALRADDEARPGPRSCRCLRFALPPTRPHSMRAPRSSSRVVPGAQPAAHREPPRDRLRLATARPKHARVRHRLRDSAPSPSNVMSVHRQPDPLPVDRAEGSPNAGERRLKVSAPRVDSVPAKPLRPRSAMS